MIDHSKEFDAKMAEHHQTLQRGKIIALEALLYKIEVIGYATVEQIKLSIISELKDIEE